MSGAEDLLAWQMDQVGMRYQRQFRFHPKRLWRFDFRLCWPEDPMGCCPEPRIAVEVDGGTWVEGRHTRGAGFALDCEKFNEAVLLGWRVLRVTPEMVQDGRALQWIERIVRGRVDDAVRLTEGER